MVYALRVSYLGQKRKYHNTRIYILYIYRVDRSGVTQLSRPKTQPRFLLLFLPGLNVGGRGGEWKRRVGKTKA